MKNNYIKYFLITSLALFIGSDCVIAQTTANKADSVEYLPFGDMNSWIKRIVEESGIIGGKTKILYEVTNGLDIVKPNVPYSNRNGSPWGTANVYAHVSIVHKGVNTVKPAKRAENDYCAMMETTLETVKVLGVINLNVIATGTLFIGEMIEPITSTDDANQYLDRGMPFNYKPKSLVFDYSLINVPKRMYASGLGKPKEIAGKNGAEIILILQKRWEDSEGNIHAKRVGTIWKRLFDEDGVWHNNYKLDIKYGNIKGTEYDNEYVALDKNPDPSVHTIYARNSKGVIKPVIELGFANDNDMPTHLVMSFSSGWGGAYMGSPGTKFYVDNIGFIR